MSDQTQTQETDQGSQDNNQEINQGRGAAASGASHNEEGFWRRKYDTLEKKVKDLERGRMSDADRLRAEAEEHKSRADKAEGTLRETQMQRSFESQAKLAGIIDPELAFLAARSSLEVDDQGNLVGTEKAIQALRKSKPHLFSNQGRLGSNGGNTPSHATGQSRNQVINNNLRRAAGR